MSRESQKHYGHGGIFKRNKHIKEGPEAGVRTFVVEGQKALKPYRSLDQIWFSCFGGSGDEDVFYYRIHSPVDMIELDHHSLVFIVKKGEPNPGPVNWHVHIVVRTPNRNDYGKDLLL